MPQSKSHRSLSQLGYGAFTCGGEDDSVIWDARRIFLTRIEDLSPEVLAELEAKVWPHYQQPAELAALVGHAPESTPPGLTRLPKLTNLQTLTHCSEIPHPVHSETFVNALSSWLKRFNIDEEWVLDCVFRTLHAWVVVGRFHHWVHFVPVPQQPFLRDDLLEFEFVHPGWHVGMLTRDEAEAQIRTVFEYRLIEYLDQVESTAEERGLKPSIIKRPRHGEDPFRHFDWLVRFQVQKWTQKAIAEEYRCDPKTVAAGIKGAAELVGLRRRSARRKNT